jgi:long-subunit acyl-CoA synthetase (AMP-forming)
MEKDGPHNKISLCNTKIKGVKAFDTGDLIERHPRKKDLWRVYGRVEDQIVLQSGLRTNPLPIGMSLRFCSYLAFTITLELTNLPVSPEMMISQSPYVKYCAMFGSNRPCVGALIEPDGDNVEIFDPAEVDLLTRFRNSVW